MDLKLSIEKVSNYELLSEKCADILIQMVTENPCANIVLATGHSPLLAYRKFVKKVQKSNINLSNVTFIKLDEWVGLDPDDLATCEYFIRQEILNPLEISDEAYIGFDSKAKDLELECIRIKKLLESLQMIDLMILGVGKNGHLGLNEPDEYLTAGPHVVQLDNKTKQHAMLNNTKANVQYGITLGMKDILCSDKVVLLVSGEEKKQAFEAICKGAISTRVPATMLNLHKNVLCIVENQVME